MILHIVPQIYNENPALNIGLVDVAIPELKLQLRNGVDLTVGKPYPNKCYLVGRRKKGRKAYQGFLVKFPGRLDAFTVVSRWAINAEVVITHVAKHTILDSDFDLVSQDTMLLYGIHNTPFRARWPLGEVYNLPPLALNACMRFESYEPTKNGVMTNNEYRGDFIFKRTQTLALPTIEPERLTSGFRNNAPLLADAFLIDSISNIPEQE